VTARKPKRPPKSSPNGQPARPKRSRAKPAPAPAPAPAEPTSPPPEPPHRNRAQEIADELALRDGHVEGFILASTISPRSRSWWIKDLIPANALSFIAGPKGAGKSSLLTWLLAHGDRTLLLPGYEESMEEDWLPRLRAANVLLRGVGVVRGTRWLFPQDADRLASLCRQHRAGLVVIDPIDSYVAECCEKDGPACREALESLVKVCHQASVSIVAARHPGKAAGNVMRGSVSWANVPRVIIECVIDDGPPVRRFVRRWKGPPAVLPQPREYILAGEPGCSPQFILGEEVVGNDLDMVGVTDPVDRSRIAQAVEFVEGLLCSGALPSKQVYLAAETERFGEKLVYRAARRCGVQMEREGMGHEHKSIWSLLPDHATRVTHRLMSGVRERERRTTAGATPPTPDSATETPRPVTSTEG
jgi:hypothetical protein